MIPTAFVAIDRLALNASGKVDATLCRSRPGCRSHRSGRASRRARAAALEIWRDILSVGQLGIRDSFFDFGGHSLLAVRLFARLEDESVLFFRSRRCSKHHRRRPRGGDPSRHAPGVRSLAGRDPARRELPAPVRGPGVAEASSAITRSRGCSTGPAVLRLQSRGLDGTRRHGPGSKT